MPEFWTDNGFYFAFWACAVLLLLIQVVWARPVTTAASGPTIAEPLLPPSSSTAPPPAT